MNFVIFKKNKSVSFAIPHEFADIFMFSLKLKLVPFGNTFSLIIAIDPNQDYLDFSIFQDLF